MGFYKFIYVQMQTYFAIVNFDTSPIPMGHIHSNEY